MADHSQHRFCLWLWIGRSINTHVYVFTSENTVPFSTVLNHSNTKDYTSNFLPLRFSAYSPRSMFRAHLMNLWLVHTRGSASMLSHWCLRTARACRTELKVKSSEILPFYHLKLNVTKCNSWCTLYDKHSNEFCHTAHLKYRYPPTLHNSYIS
jgi:hypothetical protein